MNNYALTPRQRFKTARDAVKQMYPAAVTYEAEHGAWPADYTAARAERSAAWTAYLEAWENTRSAEASYQQKTAAADAAMGAVTDGYSYAEARSAERTADLSGEHYAGAWAREHYSQAELDEMTRQAEAEGHPAAAASPPELTRSGAEDLAEPEAEIGDWPF